MNHCDPHARTLFGFWLYLMTDCILFAVLFATYFVLITGTAQGPSLKDLIHLPFIFIATWLLLTSSFTMAIAMLHSNIQRLIRWMIPTFLLGLAFLIMQGMEISRLIAMGSTWQKSAFLSAYHTLLATHAVHVLFGLLFMIIFLVQALWRGLTPVIWTRLSCLRLFWLFLDLVWIVTFTAIYLVGGS